MGCGATLKVNAITQPTNREDQSKSPERPFRRTHFRYKLPAEVLQGFAEVLKIVSRKSEKRKKPQVAEPSELSANVSQLDHISNKQSEVHEDALSVHRADSRSVNVSGVRDSPDLPAAPERRVSERQPQPEQPASFQQHLPETHTAVEPPSHAVAEPPLTVNTHKDEHHEAEPKPPEPRAESPTQVEDFLAEKTDSVQAEEFPLGKQKSIFYRVDDQREDQPMVSEAWGSAKKDPRDESDLLSPEAPRVLPDEEYEEPEDSSSRKAARQELERLAQEEAERIAADKRQKDEQVLEDQRGKMKGMEDAAQSIMSKYQ